MNHRQAAQRRYRRHLKELRRGGLYVATYARQIAFRRCLLEVQAAADVEVIESAAAGYGDLRCEPGIDFLETDFCGCESIVSNPPFKIAEQVIAHALGLTRAGEGQVAMLLRTDWSAAARRRPLLKDHPAFACKVELTARPNWVQDAGSPRFNYSWFVWDWAHVGRPTIRWAP